MLKNRPVNIACIQETKWKGSKAKEIGDGYKLIYRGTRTRNGVAIVVDQDFRNNVTSVHRVSERLMSIKIDSTAITAHVVSCYAPQTGCTEDEKDKFWNSPDVLLREVPQDESIIVGGNLNGHFRAHKEGYMRCHGGHGLGVWKDDGCWILDFAESHDLIVTNTYFKKRPTHLANYTSGGHATEIDYWLFRHQDMKLVTDTKVIPYDCITPQH
ncbi:uncharacterized protein LOC126212707 [Schistocerca nitens]|uniref:uncharacterized protein LOC126212707 n=1 Tax=Schistocerca nitens TaxID=7011 RepID=UPI002118EE14|nr:uncharacterized protein LOC126212707 [Schistocerca nitens]